MGTENIPAVSFTEEQIAAYEKDRNVVMLTWIMNRGVASAKENARQALIRLGDQSLMPLIATLKSGNNAEQMLALTTIGDIHDFQAIEPLLETIRNEDRFSEYNRILAAEALTKIGSASVEPLIGELENQSWQVRRLAVKALGKIKDEAAQKALQNALNDKHIVVRKQAERSLGIKK
jgi:HEAT repeat protein